MEDLAIVTGSASGIGQACVRRLNKQGIPVVGMDLSDGSSSDLLAWVQGDISEQSAWEAALEKAAIFDRKPSILIFAAAYLTVGNVLTLTDEDWDRVFGVNVHGLVKGLRTFLPGMIEQKRGSIVTIGSVDSYMAEQGLVAYCASKGAVLQMTRTIAVDHARDGIRANCVCPGVTDTPFFRRHLDTASDPEQFVKVREERNPLGRLLDPDEVAAMAVFLTSDESSATTGATIVVDAGLTASFDFRTGEEGS